VVRPCPARRGRRGHWDRRRQDRDALLPHDHRGCRRLARRASAAARRRPGHGRQLRGAAARGRCGGDARRPPLSACDGRDAESARGAGADRRGRIAGGAGRGARRPRRAGRARHRRTRRLACGPPLRRQRAPRDAVRAPGRGRDARSRLHARGFSLVEAARGAAAAASRAVAHGLVEIGAGDGPVDVLGVAAR
jgi:hypothetical protein